MERGSGKAGVESKGSKSQKLETAGPRQFVFSFESSVWEGGLGRLGSSQKVQNAKN